MKKIKKLNFIAIFAAVIISAVMLLKYYNPVGDLGKNAVAFAKERVADYMASKRISEEFNNYSIASQSTSYTADSINTVPVLAYHGIPGTAGKDIDVSSQTFKEQMFALKKNGYQTVKLEDFYAFLRGEKKLPPKSFLLTFDDGIKSSYYNTDAVLKELGYNAIIFVISGYSLDHEKNRYYLVKDELLQMEKTGRWEIQSHSYLGHAEVPIDGQGDKQPFFGNKMWLKKEKRLETDAEYKARVSSDLQKAKTQLEETLGHSVYAFAIPYNNFGQLGSNYPAAQSVLFDLYKNDYNMVFFQFRPVEGADYTGNYNDKKSNFYPVMRIGLFKSTTAEKLLSQLGASEEKTLPYSEKFNNSSDWITLWGTKVYNKDSVLFKSNQNSTSSMNYLDGSYLWSDYNFEIIADWNKGDYASLVSRYKNSANFAVCGFRNGAATIEQRLNNVTKIIAQRKLSVSVPQKDARLGMSVSGDVVICSMNGKNVLAAKIDRSLNYGGVGVKTWDGQVAGSELLIKKLNVNKVK